MLMLSVRVEMVVLIDTMLSFRSLGSGVAASRRSEAHEPLRGDWDRRMSGDGLRGGSSESESPLAASMRGSALISVCTAA